MSIIEGNTNYVHRSCFAIVAAKFNRNIVDRLVTGAMAALKQHKVSDSNVDLVWVPGSYEIPLVAQRLAASKKYVAIIGLGAVIKGDTDHYEYVSRAVSDGILQAGLATGVPVIFGVLTCQSDEQAEERTGGKHGNKGADAALAAMEMAHLLKQLP